MMLSPTVALDRQVRRVKKHCQYHLVLADDGVYIYPTPSVFSLFSDMALVEELGFSGNSHQMAYALEQGVFFHDRIFVPTSEIIMVYGREECGVPVLSLFTHMGKFAFTFTSFKAMLSWKTVLTAQ
jgi:hypothetical protein